MTEVKLISAVEAHDHVKNGMAVLVCAYDSDDKFKNVQLEGAIPLSEFQARLGTLDKKQELVFYCA
jgi:hypothetical protein